MKMFDPAQYIVSKSKDSIVSLAVDGDAITATTKVFSAIDGTPMENAVDIVSISQMQSTIAAYQSVIDNYNALLADI